jgi:hypothetical protein
MQDKLRSRVSEDRLTGVIESQTSKIPSSGYLAAAFGAITASAILKIVGKEDLAPAALPFCCKPTLTEMPPATVPQIAGSDAYSKAA